MASTSRRPQPSSSRRPGPATKRRGIQLPLNGHNGHQPRRLIADPEPCSPDNERKQRGGYYTPASIAKFLAEWAIRSEAAHVLEPSAGDGEVVAAAARLVGNGGRIVAVELHGDEAGRAALRGGARTTVLNSDFFSWFSKERPIGQFDAVVGNPPFIRYQDFPESHRQPAFALMREEGLHPSRLTNAWLPFVTAATRALRRGGRLALVLPAELLQVMYAAELREYLARRYSRLTIVTFKRLVFDGIQQEIVLLLGIRGESIKAQISLVELDGPEDLRTRVGGRTQPVAVDLDHAREKWTQYYLSPCELALIRELEQSAAFARLGDLAQVDVGIVTGRNEFFVVRQSEGAVRGIAAWCLPLVGRSAQIPGLVLRTREWQRLAKEDEKCHLVQFGAVERVDLPAAAAAYVQEGEAVGFHLGYKCRVRMPKWWNVPSPWVPDAFLLRQIHDGPRIVQNRAGATCTDTIHRLRMRNGTSAGWLAAASMNSLTFAFAEIVGRSYGGGVLELEPTEAERLPVPRPHLSELPLDALDARARQATAEETLSEVDRLVLKPAGLSQKDVKTLRGIWRKLCERRKSRKRRG